MFLPEKSGIIKRVENKSTTSLIGLEVKSEFGVLRAVADKSLVKYIGSKVRFRENFSEEIVIEGEKLLFFRDLEASIFYIETNGKM